jgi:ABC-type multidrug transport system ATPase subunit
VEFVVIVLRDVVFSYSAGPRVLDRVSFEFGSGLTLILGPNGAGKSTLLKVIAGVERPEAGRVEIRGFDLWKNEVQARRNLAYVPEHPDLTPYATIRDVIYLVCRLRSQPLAAGDSALDRAGIRAFADRSIRELSMGQRRRAVLAATWIGEPKVVIMDEPLEGMDRLIRKDILDWIANLVANDAAVIIATHQIEPFIAAATRILNVRNGGCLIIDPLPVGPAARMQLLGM